MELHEYLDELISQIRCKKARGMVEEEVRAHIEDQAEAYRQSGMNPEEALGEAVRQMGDPVEAGVALDRIHRPHMDFKLLLIVGVLILLGVGIQYVMLGEGEDFSLFYRHCLYTGAGVFMMLLICWLDYSVIGKYPVWWWLGFSALVLGVCLWGPRVNGGNNYIRPVIYLYVPIYAGILYWYRGGGYGDLLRCVCFLAASLWISMRGISIPVCLDVLAICLVLTLLAVWKGWFAVPKKSTIGSIVGMAVVFPAAVLFWGMDGGFAPYQIRRIYAVVDPLLYGQEAGYHTTIVRRLLQTSKLLGQGMDGVPIRLWGEYGGSGYTEYIFTNIILYYGILAGVAILLLLVMFLCYIFRVSFRQKNQLGQMTGIGCSLVFAVQLYHYVLWNLGAGIFTGINIPFLAYGKWAAISTYALTGLLLSIHRYKDVSPDQKPGCRQRYRLRIERIQ